MNPNVFIVFVGPVENTLIAGVYSSAVDADERADELFEQGYEAIYVEEHEMDKDVELEVETTE